MIVQHNMTALNANRQLGITVGQVAKSTEKLSSGYRINRAGDDAAGLSISEKMRGQIRGLEQASTNAQDGVSLIQTAEGALNEIHSIVQRMRELTVQAANDTNVSIDRMSIAKEIYALTSEITRIGEQTEFNTMKLLDGSFGQAGADKKLQVGANSGQQINIKIDEMTASAIGITDAKVGDVIAKSDATSDTISSILDIMDKALSAVSTQRSSLGAIQNRLEHTIANADNVAENLTDAESRIRDVNMADEMVQFSKNNILQQAGQSMLAQANQSTQGVLSLL